MSIILNIIESRNRNYVHACFLVPYPLFNSHSYSLLPLLFLLSLSLNSGREYDYIILLPLFTGKYPRVYRCKTHVCNGFHLQYDQQLTPN